jgi:hypothetical protein
LGIVTLFESKQLRGKNERKLASELLAAAFRYRPERIDCRNTSKKIYITIPTSQAIAALGVGIAIEYIM